MSNHFATRRRRLPACLMGLWLCPAAPGFANDLTRTPLSLHEAEHMALAHDPVTRQREAQALAFSERAVAEGQLPDP